MQSLKDLEKDYIDPLKVFKVTI